MASAVEAFLVGGSMAIAATASNPGSSWNRYVLIVLLGLAMGMQNAVARKLAVPDLTTTVLTLTITGIVADGRLAGGGGSKAGRRLLSVLAMLVGGLVGALLILRVSRTLGIAVALAILCLIAATGATVSRTDRGWIHPRPAN